MWKRALIAGLLAGIGVGTGGTLLLAEGEPQSSSVPQARSFVTVDALLDGLREAGVTCTPLVTRSKYPVCELPGGGPILTVRSVSVGTTVGGILPP